MSAHVRTEYRCDRCERTAEAVGDHELFLHEAFKSRDLGASTRVSRSMPPQWVLVFRRPWVSNEPRHLCGDCADALSAFFQNAAVRPAKRAGDT